uniref:Uncharacterized protein n=1 Tax=Arundo donax TaxID=35708 RepID=A0A0A9CZ58_ARUDO
MPPLVTSPWPLRRRDAPCDRACVRVSCHLATPVFTPPLSPVAVRSFFSSCRFRPPFCTWLLK